jgi:hypothetical protein
VNIAFEGAGWLLISTRKKPAGERTAKIYLVDAAVVGDELEARPGPVGLLVREMLAKVVEASRSHGPAIRKMAVQRVVVASGSTGNLTRGAELRKC